MRLFLNIIIVVILYILFPNVYFPEDIGYIFAISIAIGVILSIMQDIKEIIRK